MTKQGAKGKAEDIATPEALKEQQDDQIENDAEDDAGEEPFKKAQTFTTERRLRSFTTETKKRDSKVTLSKPKIQKKVQAFPRVTQQ